MRRVAGALLIVLTTSCSRTIYEAHFAPPAQLEKISEAATRAPFIKCHTPDGRVFVLERWSIEDGTETIRGYGIEYAPSRARNGKARDYTLAFKDIALIETNRPYSVDVGTGSVIGMLIGTGASVALSLVCLGLGSTCYP
jgi:hypothetical protein